jgi:Fibronectin type III domain
MIVAYRFVFSLAFGLFLVSLTSCGGEENGGATASLTWQPPVDNQTVLSYTVHYGKQSSGTPGSCNYENSLDVTEPAAIVAGLEFSSTYYFAVSAYNGLHSACSVEVSKTT